MNCTARRIDRDEEVRRLAGLPKLNFFLPHERRLRQIRKDTAKERRGDPFRV